MWEGYPCSTIQEQNIVKVLRVYVVVTIFLLIFDHHDTEYEWFDMEIGVSGPILT